MLHNYFTILSDGLKAQKIGVLKLTWSLKAVSHLIWRVADIDPVPSRDADFNAVRQKPRCHQKPRF